MIVKPFVKWAGGKSQLLNDISNNYPVGLGSTVDRYCEPFVGGGAVLFDILSNYSMKEVLINDINAELINTYQQIKEEPDRLIDNLLSMQDEFWPLDKPERKDYYYNKRERFNSLIVSNSKKDYLEKAALFIFLNKTCFNGLYRVNKKGLFNVPVGSYKKPLICDRENLTNISKLLQEVEIRNGDYKNCLDFAKKNTFYYIDPPYRPLTETASFTAYAKGDFTDKEQIELGDFVDKLSAKGAKVILSNSDPKNTNKKDDFFDDLYSEYIIYRVMAKRMINCNGDSRGNVSELIISNYGGA